jgi:simple sugar transport system permease protein
MPGIAFPGTAHKVYGFLLIAVAVGIGYWLLVKRTRFGFDLRAAGANPSAAVASGVSVRKMIVVSMLISGGVAGLVGLPLLLGETHQFTTDFPTGIGFTGIAIALLGRNHPVGIAFAALFWSFLDRSAQILDLDGIPREIVVIMQGVSVLAVVVAYEVVGRARRQAEQRRVGKQLGSDTPDEPDEPAVAAGAPKGAPA